MNFPAIAKHTYDLLRGKIAFASITDFVIQELKKIPSPIVRARFVHSVVDDYNREVFSHPLVKEFSPCKAGCSGCCHTQVSVTEDEAELLAHKIKSGIKINYALMSKQANAGNSSEDFYKLSYESRKCIFLGENDLCQVYEDRPSVCRTNAVLGEADQCETRNGIASKQTYVLVKTPQSDMAIMGAFLSNRVNGTMAYMVGRVLTKKKSISNSPQL